MVLHKFGHMETIQNQPYAGKREQAQSYLGPFVRNAQLHCLSSFLFELSWSGYTGTSIVYSVLE